MTPDYHFDVVVIGAGIAGLVVASRLQRAGLVTLLIEERDVVGGLLSRTRLGDLEVDAGAESFSTRNSSVEELIAEHCLDLTIARPSSFGAMLLAGSGGRTTRSPLPRATLLGIPGRPWAPDVRRSIGMLGSLRALADRIMPARVGRRATSIGALVERRMGRRTRVQLVDSICRSVYSTQAHEIDIDTVAPRLREELEKRGSLSAAARIIASGVQPGSAAAGIDGGLWQLAPSLADAFVGLGGTLWTASSARSATRADSADIEVLVAVRGTETHVSAREVVVATPGPQAAVLLGAHGTELSRVLLAASFRGVTVACVRLACAGLDDHPVGTGVIVSSSVGTRAKALTHLNAKWAWYRNRVGPHEHVLRASIDGSDPLTAQIASDRDFVAMELSTLTGMSISASDIVALTAVQWPDAVVPLDQATRHVLAEAAVIAELHGMTCVGSWLSGTGLSVVIPHARSAADRIIDRHQTDTSRQNQERQQ